MVNCINGVQLNSLIVLKVKGYDVGDNIYFEGEYVTVCEKTVAVKCESVVR